KQVFVDVFVVAGTNVLKIAMALTGVGHDLVGLGNHFEGVVVANGDALGAALAFARIDDDLEHAARHALLLAGVVIFLGLRPLPGVHIPIGFWNRLQFFFQLGFGEDLAQDGGVGAFRNAVHAGGAILGDVFGYFRRDVAEVAERGRAGWDQRPGHGK